jgi:hypothetical protein
MRSISHATAAQTMEESMKTAILDLIRSISMQIDGHGYSVMDVMHLTLFQLALADIRTLPSSILWGTR